MTANIPFLYSLATFSAINIFIVLYNSSFRDKVLRKKHKEITGSSSVTAPPLEVINLLKSSKLCFLATVSNQEPHISLMNFTYDQVILNDKLKIKSNALFIAIF